MAVTISHEEPAGSSDTYQPTTVEQKWQARWQERGTNATDLNRDDYRRGEDSVCGASPSPA